MPEGSTQFADVVEVFKCYIQAYIHNLILCHIYIIQLYKASSESHTQPPTHAHSPANNKVSTDNFYTIVDLPI